CASVAIHNRLTIGVRNFRRRSSRTLLLLIGTAGTKVEVEMQRPARLIVVDTFGLEKTVSIEKPDFTIGRQPGNDLHLLSRTVSRHHLEIIFENGAYFLQDKGSKSGTYINGHRISRQELHHLDKIGIGGDEDCGMQFLDDQGSDTASDPATR